MGTSQEGPPAEASIQRSSQTPFLGKRSFIAFSRSSSRILSPASRPAGRLNELIDLVRCRTVGHSHPKLALDLVTSHPESVRPSATKSGQVAARRSCQPINNS